MDQFYLADSNWYLCLCGYYYIFRKWVTTVLISTQIHRVLGTYTPEFTI